MSRNPEIYEQILSFRQQIHSSHVEACLEAYGLKHPPHPSSARQSALFNQGLLEHFKLHHPETFSYFFEASTHPSPWPIEYLCLLPAEVLLKTFQLWSACRHCQRTAQYIAREDIEQLKQYFSENFEWLSCSELQYPAHPKFQLQSYGLLNSHDFQKNHYPVREFLHRYLPETAMMGASLISKDWPFLSQTLLLLKLPKTTSILPVFSDTALLSEHQQVIEQTLMACLERISHSWHAKFSEH